MNYLFIAFCITVASPFSPLAQESFQKTFGSTEPDRGIYVETTHDGGYIVIGQTRSTATASDDIYVIRCDSSGVKLWQKTYGGKQNDYGWCVKQTNDKGYILGCYTSSFGAGGVDFYLIRIDGEGNEIWSRTTGGEKDDFCWGVVVTKDGEYVLVGDTASYGSGKRDTLLVKFDSGGKQIWSKSFGGAEDDRCFSVLQSADGGYVFAGITNSFGAGNRDAWIVATDALGNELWSKTIGESTRDVAHSIALTDDGGYIITGYTNSYGAASDDPWLIKLKANGDIEWQKVIKLPMYEHTITGVQTSDGGYYLTGFASRARDNSAVLVLKTDASGNLLWNQHLMDWGNNFGYTIQATKDGGFVLTGHTTTTGAGNADVVLIKGVDEIPSEQQK